MTSYAQTLWTVKTDLGVYAPGADTFPRRYNCTYDYSVVEFYQIGQYILLDRTASSNQNIPQYIGLPTNHYIPFINGVAGTIYPSLPPLGIVVNNYVYEYYLSEKFVSKNHWFENELFGAVASAYSKPNYIDLLDGYDPDPRIIPSLPTIAISSDAEINISYYRVNRNEGITDLRSIDWVNYQVRMYAGIDTILPIFDCVLGTLYCSNQQVETALLSLPTGNGYYSWDSLFEANLPILFSDWFALWGGSAPAPPPVPPGATFSGAISVSEIGRTLRVLGANNNFWNNRPISTPDLNVDLSHPMFIVDSLRAYNWHIAPQSNGSYGTLIMDSPRIIDSHDYLLKLRKALQIDNYQVENLTSQPPLHYLDWYIKNSSGAKLDEIHKALEADLWAEDPNNPGVKRVANLGHLIGRIASLLGYRPEPDGTFKPATEKGLVRQIVSNNEQIDPAKVGVNNFGGLGMIVRRLNNRFNGKKIVADECVIVRDIPQLLAEYQDQLNLALGLQESSAIEIKSSDNTARYDNQLAVMVELLHLTKSNHDSIRAALVSSLVAQAQSSEIIAALGLPTVTKSLPVKIDNKIDHLPYKGVSAHRSISQEIAVCTANVGIVLGQVL